MVRTHSYKIKIKKEIIDIPSALSQMEMVSNIFGEVNNNYWNNLPLSTDASEVIDNLTPGSTSPSESASTSTQAGYNNGRKSSFQPSWLRPDVPIKKEPTTALDEIIQHGFITRTVRSGSTLSSTPSFRASVELKQKDPEPAGPRYSDDDQSTLDDARYTCQEAAATRALVKALGFLPAQKKDHGRRNAIRARSVLSRLIKMEEELKAWKAGDPRDDKEQAIARIVEGDIAGWLSAVLGCGCERWEVSDVEYCKRARAGLDELELQIRMFGRRLPRSRSVFLATEAVREISMKYLEVFHLVTMGWGNQDSLESLRLEDLYRKMLKMTTSVNVEEILRAQAVMISTVLAGVAVGKR